RRGRATPGAVQPRPGPGGGARGAARGPARRWADDGGGVRARRAGARRAPGAVYAAGQHHLGRPASWGFAAVGRAGAGRRARGGHNLQSPVNGVARGRSRPRRTHPEWFAHARPPGRPRLPALDRPGGAARRHVRRGARGAAVTASPRNLVLIGMSGTGKSRVGRLVAERLRWRFLDTDLEIERRAGRSVQEIFAADGEERFRTLEREVIAKIAQRSGAVISTGGGAVLDPGNREVLFA